MAFFLSFSIRDITFPVYICRYVSCISLKRLLNVLPPPSLDVNKTCTEREREKKRGGGRWEPPLIIPVDA